MKKKIFAAILAAVTACGVLCTSYVSAESLVITDISEIESMVQERLTVIHELEPEEWTQSTQFTPGHVDYYLSNTKPEGTEDKVVVVCSWFIQRYLQQDLKQFFMEQNIHADCLYIISLESGEAPRKGNYNYDSTVDITDAQNVLSSYTEIITGHQISYLSMYVADVDNDYHVTAADAQIILQYYTCKDVAKVIDETVSVTDFWQNYDSYMPHEKQGGEIAFTEVAADYSKFSGGTELQKNNEAKSRVIYNSEQLAHNPIQPVNPYSDAFFEDHALIFVCIVFQSMASDSPVITGIHCEDHSIQIAAERESAPMEMIELWCTFLEVKKTDLPAADEEVVFDFDITEGDETNTNKIHIVQ